MTDGILKYEIYSGAGNDFVMVNNFDGVINQADEKAITIKLCEKDFPNIDGAIFVETPISKEASVRMNYYNRDGSFGAMCGNGARCTAMFAYRNKLMRDRTFNLEAVDKIYTAEIIDEENVKIGFPSDIEIKLNLKTIVEGIEYTVHYVNVGSEHLVLFIDSLKELDVESIGRQLRYHEAVLPAGANINFVKLINEEKIQTRTYERGVERETLACGTGIISSAIISSLLGKVFSPVHVLVQSGEWLCVRFNKTRNNISDITLEGSAKKIREGFV